MSLRIAVCYLLYIMMHVINLQKVDIELQSCILCIKLINLVRWQILSSIYWYYTPVSVTRSFKTKCVKICSEYVQKCIQLPQGCIILKEIFRNQLLLHFYYKITMNFYDRKLKTLCTHLVTLLLTLK